MSGDVCEWSRLAPTRHAAVYQPRIPGHTDVGPKAEPFHHTGPHRIDDSVGTFDQTQDGLYALWMLEVDSNGRSAAATDVRLRPRVFKTESGWTFAVDPDDVSAHVRQEPTTERRRPDTGDLNHLVAGERAALVSSVRHSFNGSRQ